MESGGLANHVQQDLSRALEPIEQTKDGADRLLYAAVGIHFQAGLAAPQISDRDRDPIFAALGFRLDPFDEPATHQRQLEFAHGALEAEEQTIIGNARIIGAIEIDDPRAHETTQLEHVMPVSSVARQARGFEAEHRADRPLTQLGHARLESGTRHQPAGGSPEIVIDRHDVPEAVRPGEIGQPILPALTFQVVVHLGAGRLPHVHDGAAFHHIAGKLTASHRVPRNPPLACMRWSAAERAAERPRPV